MAIATVGVVGAGLMGSGIAEVFARHGYSTHVWEVDAPALAAGRERIERSLDRGVKGGKLSPDDAAATRAALHFSDELGDLASCDFVIECVVEQLEAKLAIFRRLDQLVRADVILASNTSSLPIIELAAATARADRVVGMHFFNPAPVMKLVELVRTLETSDATIATVTELATALGKQTILAQDRGGFIVNLLLIPFLINAVRMYESGFATREDIDSGMRLGCAHPMGPLELADHVGLDTTLHVCDALHAEYGKEDYVAPTLLRRMVAAGHLGRKSGRGFYTYS